MFTFGFWKKGNQMMQEEESRPNYLPLPLKKKNKVSYNAKDRYGTLELPSGFLKITYEYVGYEGPDEDGFGMEDEYDFHFFDEKNRYLGTLCAWSKRDFSINQDRIIYEMNKALKKTL